MIKVLIKDKEEVEFLPAELREFFDNPKTLESLNKISSSFNLKEEQEENFRKIIVKLLKGDYDLYNLPSLFEEKLEVDLTKAMDMDNELYVKLFSSIEDTIKAQYAAHQASNPQEIPKIKKEDVKKIKKEGKRYNFLTQKAIEKFNLQFKEGEEARFKEICETFLKNARTGTQFKETLKKDFKGGGMGYDEKLAADISKFFNSYIRINELEKKKEKEKGAPRIDVTKEFEKKRDDTVKKNEERVRRGVIQKVVPVVVKKEIGFEEEEREAESLKGRVKELGSVSKNNIKEKVKKALDEIDVQFPSSELQERLRLLIDSRLRDVRTSTQTYERLVLDTTKGGLGMKDEEADKISLILNKYLNNESKDIYKSKLDEMKKFNEKSLQNKKELENKAKTRKREQLDKRFEELSLKGKKPKKPQIEKSKQEKKSVPNKSKEVKNKIPIIENDAPFFSAKNNNFEKPAKPVLEDISYKPKLSGPIEEIDTMTIRDFRSLSGDPKEAILKISDKLGLLREESYKKYEEGRRAWKNSPVFKDAIAIVGVSLKNKISLDEAIKKQSSLTKEEFDVIINNEGR